MKLWQKTRWVAKFRFLNLRKVRGSGGAGSGFSWREETRCCFVLFYFLLKNNRISVRKRWAVSGKFLVVLFCSFLRNMFLYVYFCTLEYIFLRLVENLFIFACVLFLILVLSFRGNVFRIIISGSFCERNILWGLSWLSENMKYIKVSGIWTNNNSRRKSFHRKEF